VRRLAIVGDVEHPSRVGPQSLEPLGYLRLVPGHHRPAQVAPILALKDGGGIQDDNIPWRGYTLDLPGHDLADRVPIYPDIGLAGHVGHKLGLLIDKGGCQRRLPLDVADVDDHIVGVGQAFGGGLVHLPGKARGDPRHRPGDHPQALGVRESGQIARRLLNPLTPADGQGTCGSGGAAHQRIVVGEGVAPWQGR